jgi:endonuclease YncB( thermonuclease family)
MNQFVKIIIILLVLISFSGCIRTKPEAIEGSRPYIDLPDEEPMTEAVVTKVIRPDLVEIQDGSLVSLHYISAPDKENFLYAEAVTRLEELVLNKKIMLEREGRDKYPDSSYVRHIYADDKNAALVLVKEGYAEAPFARIYGERGEEFLEAERQAKAQEIGIWEKSDYSSCIETVTWKHCGTAHGCGGNEEYLEFKNNCTFEIDLTNWSIRHGGRQAYKFKEFKLGFNESVRLYGGSGNDTSRELYLNGGYSEWASFCHIYIRDAEGKLVSDIVHCLAEYWME